MNMESRRIKKNKREQKRVKRLRRAFQELREVLPANYQKTACTKAQILKGASVYIRHLKLKLQDVEEKGTQDSPDNCQARPSCRYAKGQEDVSYLTHSMQSQSSVPFAASPSYYQGTTKNFCWSALSTETCGFSEEAKCTCGVRGDRHKCFFPQCSNS